MIAPAASVHRLALRPEEAASALGVSVDYFGDHIAIARLKLHGARRTLHVHEANANITFCANLQRAVGTQGIHIIHH